MKGLTRTTVRASGCSAAGIAPIRRPGHAALANAVLAIVSIAVQMSPAMAQGVVWDSAWNDSAPPAFASFDGYYAYPLKEKAAPVTFGPAGDMLLISPSHQQFDEQVLHIDAAGSLLWATNFYVGGAGPGAVASSVLGGDGGAFVSFGGSRDLFGYPDYVASIDATGAIQWLREISARQLQLLSANELLATGFQGITALDPATGNALWSFRGCSGAADCNYDGAVVDAGSNAYATYGTTVSYGVPLAHLVKLNAAGTVAWDAEFSGPGSVFSGPATTPLGVVGSTVFVRSGGDIVAFDTTAGTPVWTNAFGATDGVMAGISPEPVAISSNSISRLAADTGQPRWSVPLSEAVDIAITTGGSVVVHASSGLTRINAETGEVLWTKPLPEVTPGGDNLHYIAVGATDASHLAALATASSDTYGGWPPAHLEQVDFSTGDVAGEIALPSVNQGLYGASVQAAGGDVFAAAPDAQAGPPQMRVKRIGSTDGAAAWSAAEPLPAAVPNNAGFGFAGVATTATGVVAAASTGAGLASRVWLGMFEAASGSKRWTHVQGEAFQAYTSASNPVTDPDGNVYISYGMYTFCDMSFLTFCDKQILAKLSGADGNETWRYYVFQDLVGGPLPPVNGSQTFAPNFALAGSDVLAIEPFGYLGYQPTIVKLSGADGSVLWSSGALSSYYGVSDAHTLGDGSVIAIGSGWAKLNGHNGHTVWESQPVADPKPCFPCYAYSSLFLDNGDYIRAGENNGLAEVVRLRGDGSGIADFWYPDTGAGLLRSYVQDLQIDSQGQIWSRLTRRVRAGSLAVQFLAQFDLNSGLFVGEQAIGSVDEDLTATSRTVHALLAPPVDNHVVVQTFEQLHPQPTTTGSALLDNTVSAHGDIAVQVTSTTKAYSGMPVSFHITANYTGDVPIAGAVLDARMPWPTGIRNLHCTTSAAQNCVLDAKSGNLYSTFDISPGGQIDIDGDVTYLDMGPDTATIGVAAYGPIGLLEQDTVNNFASAKTVESLFFNGFE